MTDTAALAEVRRLYGLLRQAEDEIALLRQDNAQLRIQLSGRPVHPGPADREPMPWWRDRRPRPPQAAPESPVQTIPSSRVEAVLPHARNRRPSLPPAVREE
ncbi:hypothetical protein DN069_27775 [Streptacidiphilus pinicola]|uniref:Uncharacterized protein n=1 Tax=Streptacidiphilus pinicola TaxID=2219663 RepID=A0A2X0JZS1_9ACTN|nr:hypothetical protein [Streptacidiphilus pinicola]RAG82465.1 hypothetical protein DN069_27775 [Streptacidiphilus pinicola]